MMRVRMVADRPGGPDWAAPGCEADFPDDQARFLIERGDAVAVQEPEPAEAAKVDEILGTGKAKTTHAAAHGKAVPGR
jgi:hypothetical protein